MVLLFESNLVRYVIEALTTRWEVVWGSGIAEWTGWNGVLSGEGFTPAGFWAIHRKAHRNGIKKPKSNAHPSLKGVDPKFLRNQRRAKKGNAKFGIGWVVVAPWNFKKGGAVMGFWILLHAVTGHV
ncbi:hypothetical protein BC938DRAFT_482298 [Jimgerdemannia flammicorona]|uniref:60S ribosomal protein L29 n=1 Tax=Jimgerdemannia flammicorona TaxID=994334 RepID=A0A433QE76_9FUNG|nr:hypothetical protein BC938DRAFT_482298 [Jimgerdemannia flammicorona]